MRYFLYGVLFFLCIHSFSVLLAQAPRQGDAADIRLGLNKLNFLGSVLYVAAHPDDENTRVITYLSNGQLAATAYLSLTRGDGGQNLLGPEIRDQLGVIRTQELLAARRIDGGRQFFSRANDFGYSKSAEETLRIWGKDSVLSDVVRVYRKFQPDVIITRFPPDKRAGHGHHTASAMLAMEAFDIAAKPSAFPEQVPTLGTWQPTRLYVNTGRWWNTSIDEHTPGVTMIDVGGYNALLGTSYPEIAGRSRSQHKSQGFGSAGARGRMPEYLEFQKGDSSATGIFDGVNTTWSRLPGGAQVQPLVEKAIREFDEATPAASINNLLAIRKAILALPAGVWQERKLAEVNELIAACAGLYSEVTANTYWCTPGDAVEIDVEVVNRAAVPMVLHGIQARTVGVDTAFTAPLEDNIPLKFKLNRRFTHLPYSTPYWLRMPHTLGLFTVQDETLIGKPENDPAVSFVFDVTIQGQRMQVTRPLVYRWTDPVKGELYRPFDVVPPVLLAVPDRVLIFDHATAQPVEITLTSGSEKELAGQVRLELPPGWRAKPEAVPFTLATKQSETKALFSVNPPDGESVGTLRALAEVNGKVYDDALQTIQYDHIPTQTILPKAEAKVVRVNLHPNHGTIGYIRGAGDDIPTALTHMGFSVRELQDDEVTLENLQSFDAVVLGIRVLNTHERIGFLMNDLLEYVKQGGTLVMQYNTYRGLKTEDFAPYPLTLSRDRVTEEDAAVTILAPDHPVLNEPNKITLADFDGWVQERGLYFPNHWDASYTPILSMHDQGEEDMAGSLLVASYGKGTYVYTGLSFFRELPEGVPGAYKLFANIVSLGAKQNNENSASKKKHSKKNR